PVRIETGDVVTSHRRADARYRLEVAAHENPAVGLEREARHEHEPLRSQTDAAREGLVNRAVRFEAREMVGRRVADEKEAAADNDAAIGLERQRLDEPIGVETG